MHALNTNRCHQKNRFSTPQFSTIFSDTHTHLYIYYRNPKTRLLKHENSQCIIKDSTLYT